MLQAITQYPTAQESSSPEFLWGPASFRRCFAGTALTVWGVVCYRRVGATPHGKACCLPAIIIAYCRCKARLRGAACNFSFRQKPDRRIQSISLATQAMKHHPDLYTGRGLNSFTLPLNCFILCLGASFFRGMLSAEHQHPAASLSWRMQHRYVIPTSCLMPHPLQQQPSLLPQCCPASRQPTLPANDAPAVKQLWTSGLHLRQQDAVQHST